jgi:hypothetical protein
MNLSISCAPPGCSTAAPVGQSRQAGMGGVADLGATRCDYYVYIHPNGPAGFNQAVLYWLEGYVYARTGKAIDAFLAGAPDSGRWTFDSIGQHVLDYCTKHPQATVADGVADLWNRMQGSG